ncbi:MAG: DNA translocase FtsK [Eggerthellaceae bacterium]|nr:DNA translocase FtsK [Eggerthellaceae bacterium]
MAKSSSTGKSKPKSAQQRKRAASPAQKSGRKQTSKKQSQARQPLLDDTAHRNIVAIVCVVVALALVLIVAWPSNAVVTSFLSLWLRRLLGVGAYILPVLLVVVAGTFVAQFESERVPTRVIIGLALLYFAVLILLALFTPEALVVNKGVANIFSDDHIVYRGGYVGAGPAYLGLTLLDLPVSVIIALGIAAIGLVVIGFSVRKLIDVVDAKRAEADRIEDEELGVAADVPYVPTATPRTRRTAVSSSAETQMIPERGVDGGPMSSRAGSSGRMMPTDSQAGETQPLTRKLGKRNSESNGSGKNAAHDAQVSEAPLAALPDDGFELPKMELLNSSKAHRRTKAAESELEDTAASLQQTMEDFGIMATVVDWIAGPTVTLFEVDLPPGVRVSRLIALNDDIALALAAPGVRIFAPIPGTHFVGIEVPNAKRENVLLGDVLKDVHGGPLEMAIGKDVEGNSIICDLAKMPHLLIGGTTGSGKSVGINAMIMSMLMRATPSQVRFIMIDPKRVEFTPYNGIPHLYVPVVTEPKEAASALSWGVAEMERRLKVFSKVGARNISQYNEKARLGELGEDETAELPYIVIIIDELSDLMMNVGKEVEFSISRIAQLARAAGIHLIVATQRPSANVVTGLIKANITNRIAYNVASGLDSRVILDVSGAESLIGNGDMLLSKPEYSKPLRVQGCYVSPEEISAVVDAVKEQGEPEYHSEILKTNLISMGDTMPDGSGGSASSDDPLIWEAAEIVVASGLGSTSNIQRKLKVGYSRAGRIMDMLEEKGVVGPPNGSKPRDVLVDAMELETLRAFEENDG